MCKEINYPIQYAVLELKKSGGFQVGYRDITQGFIVSKCYVLESSIKYTPDGKKKLTHQVVFPFKDIACLEDSFRDGSPNIGEENIPSYDACNRPYPMNVVTDLFDSYEKAKIIAEEKNEEHRHNLISKLANEGISPKEKFKIFKQEFEKRLELCNLFERLALEATKDMNISEQSSIGEQEPSVKILKPIKTKLYF